MSITYKHDLSQVDWRAMKAIREADNYDNGRTPEQLAMSFGNSFRTCIAYDDDQIIGTARVLSDGVCNAYLLDVWTLSAYRRRGIARTLIDTLLEDLQGQHVYLFTNGATEFYKQLGFTQGGIGFERVVGTWLVNPNI